MIVLRYQFRYKVRDLVSKWYGLKAVHTSDMIKLHNHLGLKYVDAYFGDDGYHYYKFKVVNKKKFLLAKLKYNI